jgi:hypothetical protein
MEREGGGGNENGKWQMRKEEATYRWRGGGGEGKERDEGRNTQVDRGNNTWEKIREPRSGKVFIQSRMSII